MSEKAIYPVLIKRAHYYISQKALYSTKRDVQTLAHVGKRGTCRGGGKKSFRGKIWLAGENSNQVHSIPCKKITPRSSVGKDMFPVAKKSYGQFNVVKVIYITGWGRGNIPSGGKYGWLGKF